MNIDTSSMTGNEPAPSKGIWTSSSFLERVLIVFLIISAVVSGMVFLTKATERLTVVVPAQGGSFTEGIVGTPRFINPLLAQSQADQDLTMLVFSGLMRALPDGTIAPDLASSYDVSEDGSVYTVHIRPEAVFHDGTPLTADDVVFTIQKAQDSVIQSPQEEIWTGIDVTALDERTVVFTLPRAYAAFLENLTIGILPRHLWQNVISEEFAAHMLNTEPIGSGPFKLSGVKRNGSGIPTTYTLSAFDDSTRGRPHINTIHVRIFGNEKDVVNAYLDNDVDSLDGLDPQDAAGLEANGAVVNEFELPRVFGLFFNQNKNDDLTSLSVRKALARAVDKDKIVSDILYGFGETMDTPFPKRLFTKDPLVIEDHAQEAKTILENAGWELNKTTGFFEDEDGQPLSVRISTANTPELSKVAEAVKSDWQKAGIETTVELFDIGQLHHEIIRPRAYEILLFGQVVGRDGDLYPFWHSSQRNDPGLNVALYANITADAILENIRATLDSDTREELYASFVEEIETDVPAVFLYMPHLLYVAPQNVSGMRVGVAHTPAERFLDVHDWYVRTERIWKFLSQ